MARIMKKKMPKKPTKTRKPKRRPVKEVPEGMLGSGMAEGAARAFREREDFLKNI